GEPQVTERPGALAVRDEPDQRRQLALFATDLADIVERLGPAYEMLRTAAAVEPEAGAVYAEMNGYRLVNMTRVAQWIAARGPLRMTVDEAAGTIWTLASPDVARLLRDGRGMSKAEYARWLEDALVRVLLPD
ncbi:MAG TPA: hypothetical protein VE991_01435, partial [Acidimicrobiales bacterium]|nr:hypothetical protein [Acidimicrobiales bacterium]